MLFARVAQQPVTGAITSGIKRNPESTERYSAESASADIQRILTNQDFNSLEEVNEFISAAMTYRNAMLDTAGGAASGQAVLEPGVIVPASIHAGLPEEIEELLPEVSELWSQAEKTKTDLDRAQDIMYEAWRAGGARRVELARQALTLNKDCVDAYVLLAQEAASTVKEARDLFETAVKIAEQLLGPDALEEGGFWSRLETRPYMRARFGLSGTLWHTGERDQAIQHLQQMLQLNPGDNQGVRFQLVHWLLLESRDEELTQLLDQYAEEPTATWNFSRALHLYHLKNDQSQAEKALKQAIKGNPYVAPLLLGKRELPDTMPAYIGFGDEDEAVEYASMGRDAWIETPGALGWLDAISEALRLRVKHPAHKLWINYMEAAQRTTSEGKYRQAKGQLLYALKQAEKFGEDEYLSKTISTLAFVCLEVGAAPDEEHIFRKAVSLTEAIFGPDHLNLAVDLYHLAAFLLDHKRKDEAQPVLDRAAMLADQNQSDHLLSNILDLQASLYEAQGKVALARQARLRSKQLHDELDEDDENFDG